MSATNIWPGAWVIAKDGLALASAFCGVTPQAQKTVTCYSFIVTGSPKSGRSKSFIPRKPGSPICNGAP